MCIVMLTLLEALDELNSKSESELTLDYLEELAKKVSIEPVPHLTIKGSEMNLKLVLSEPFFTLCFLTKCHFRLCIYSGRRTQAQKPGLG